MRETVINALANSVKLYDAQLEHTDLSLLDLSYSNFENANLLTCNFFGSDFTMAKFMGANCTTCNFQRATLFACDFSRANLRGANFRNSLGLAATIFDGYGDHPTDVIGCTYTGSRVLVGDGVAAAYPTMA
jgi:uncharacterized protein YjbI with pentapeptide repeats